MLAGDPGAAAATLRRSYETLTEMGERSFRSTIAGLLAHALCAVGEDDEAERFSRAGESAASSEDVYSQVLWRSARAKVLARRGEGEAAEATAREAVALAERTDLLNTQADTLLDLAEVLALAGRHDEAEAAAREAAERFERKEAQCRSRRAPATAAATSRITSRSTSRIERSTTCPSARTRRSSRSHRRRPRRSSASAPLSATATST